jgi:hypothetical protein
VAALLVAGAIIGAFYLGTSNTATIVTTTSEMRSLSCDPSSPGTGFYLRISSDSGGVPVTNATVDATPVRVCNGVATTTAIVWQPAVNSSGVASLNASFVTYYSLVVHYSNQTYKLKADLHSFQTTVVNLSVPSGRVNITSK